MTLFVSYLGRFFESGIVSSSLHLVSDQYFSIESLNEMVQGDAALLNNLLRIFIKDAETTSRMLSMAIAEGDYRAIKEMAHGLKGVCSVLMMAQVQDIIVNIELLALEKRDLARIRELFQGVETILETVIQKLRLYLEAG